MCCILGLLNIILLQCFALLSSKTVQTAQEILQIEVFHTVLV